MTKEEIKNELYRMLSNVVNGGCQIRNNAQKGRYREAVKEAIEVLEKEQKTGRWLPTSDINKWGYECSECEGIDDTNLGHFCKWCGIKMEVKIMSNLEKAKEIVKTNYKNARCGIFDSRNLLGDEMCTIYKDESLTIDICYEYSYFEVFGLSDAEFEELEEYYYSLKESEEEKCD